MLLRPIVKMDRYMVQDMYIVKDSQYIHRRIPLQMAKHVLNSTCTLKELQCPIQYVTTIT